MLLLTSVLSVAVVGAIGFQSGRESLRESVFEQLTLIRSAQARMLEKAMRDLTSSMVVYTRGSTAEQAIAAFTAGYDELRDAEVPPEQQQALVEFYQRNYGETDTESDRDAAQARVQALLPRGNSQRYLQTTYTLAADTPEDVADLRARLPNNKVYALDRPQYCNYGYNKAREEECMIYAVADLFLLSRNPGPMLRSKFSSFSDFANYYRKRAGRLMGKGFLVNGCADDGDLQEGVLTSATSASLGAERVFAFAMQPREHAKPMYGLRLPHRSLVPMSQPCNDTYAHALLLGSQNDEDGVRYNLTFRVMQPAAA